MLPNRPQRPNVLFALALGLLLATCGGEAERPIYESSEVAASALPPATGSAGAETCTGPAARWELRPQPELPPQVAATREAIYRAANRCDFATLDELAPADLRFSFGDSGDAIESWKASEANGQPVLGAMAEVLTLTPGRQAGLWVWPAFFIRPVEEWSESDHREAVRLLGEERAAAEISYGAYLGYRVGIAEDGTWRYFIAGD